MPQHDPGSPREERHSSGDGARDRHPSPAAQARLSGALRDRAEAYRSDASVDLTLVEVLLRMDEAEAAVRALDDHRASLHAMARDLQVVVADAAVEREAEAVCDAVARQLQAPPSPPARTGLRRGVLAFAGAAAIMATLVLPSARISPRTTLTSVEGRSAAGDLAAARERLEVARSWARALRADDAAGAVTVLPTREVRVARQVRSILAADTPGGSAALSSSAAAADVTDLDAYRGTRASSRPAASKPADPPPPRKALLDGIEVPTPAADAPTPGVPLSLETPEDVTVLPEAAEIETDQELP